MRIIAIMCMIVFLIIPSAFADNPAQTLQNYFNAVLDGNWEAAEYYWTPEEITRSKQLGITYAGLALKIDGASPVILNYDILKDNPDWIIIGETLLQGNLVTIPIVINFPQDTISYNYLLLKSDGGYKIISPLHAYALDWPTIDTKYFRIHFTDHTKINQYALDALDRFVEKTGQLLNISDTKFKRLENVKIDYYLCSEEQFELLTGYSAQGISNLQFNAIISQQLCHYHEISHLLVNYLFDSIPLYTLPILQEGLAVHLGGRWGKAPQVVKMLAPVLIENSICTLDTLLTWQGFNQDIGMADISYPIAGVFVETLIDELGMDKFLELYTQLSGSNDKIQSLSKVKIINKINEISGMNWDEIDKAFNRHIVNCKSSGISTGVIFDYTTPDSLEIRDSCDSYSVNISSKPCLQISIRYTNTPEWGTILLNDATYSITDEYQSWIFRDQHPDLNYSGQMYGIRFSKDEVGFYNYLTNQLIAKYINSFNSSEFYYLETQEFIEFFVTDEIFDKTLDKYQIELID